MTVTWISLAVAIVLGLTKLLTYLLGDARKIRKLKAREYALMVEIRAALAKNDTVRLSAIEHELAWVRAQLRDFDGK